MREVHGDDPQVRGRNRLLLLAAAPRERCGVSTTGISSGPISFMRVFDLATETIKQGGRAAARTWASARRPPGHPGLHPLEGDLKLFNNFNISVGLTEAFMKAVDADAEYDLVNPRSRESRPAQGREVFRSRSCIIPGGPASRGIVFLDRLNRDNPNAARRRDRVDQPVRQGDTRPFTPIADSSACATSITTNGPCRPSWTCVLARQ